MFRILSSLSTHHFDIALWHSSLLHLPSFNFVFSFSFLAIPKLLGGCKAASHALQPAGKLRVLLLHLKLRAGSLSVGQGINNLALGSGQLGGTLKVFECLVDLALLEEELSHGGDGNVTLWVDWIGLAYKFVNSCMNDGELTDKSLLAKLLGLSKVLLPLEEGKGLVDQWKDVHA